jgi:ABC-2 type transport system permease protein
MIAAILRAQWLSMRLGPRRGSFFSLATGLIWYGFWCSVSYSVYALARGSPAAELRLAVPTVLLLVCLYWQVVPVISASLGSALDMRKLLVYPVPHSKLFLVEVLLRFTTGAEMVLVLAGGLVGLLRNSAAGGWRAGPRILAPLLIYILFNLLLASGLRSLLERLLSYRHVRELLVFLMLLAVTVPRLVMFSTPGKKSLDGFGQIMETSALPWTAAGHAVLGESEWMSLVAIVCWTVAAGWFGRMQFERNLRYDAMAAQATPLRGGPAPAASWSERFYRLPSLLFRDPLAILVEKELRSLARTPRFRMVFVMGFSFGLMVWLPFVLGTQGDRHGAFGQNFLLVVCVYALTLLGQVTYWNSFGFDRSAVQIYFAAPQPISLTLLGKNIASMVFVYLEVLILTGLTLVLRVDVGPAKVLETLLVVGICSLYMLALGNISSVQYPRALKPERVSQGGASSRFQALIFILYPVALLPVFLAYLARYAFASLMVFVVILAFAAILGAALYWIAMESAVTTVAKHRERMLAELSQGDGPIASN